MAITYRGVNRRGAGCVGAVTGNVADFVEAKYKARWEWLDIERSGEVIGQITEHPDGHRTWWADAEVNA